MTSRRRSGPSRRTGSRPTPRTRRTSSTSARWRCRQRLLGRWRAAVGAAAGDDPVDTTELRRAEQPGQLQHLRRPRESAGSERRGRAEQLRRDGRISRSPSTTRAGNRLLGPVDTGTLWSGFAVPDCTDPSAIRSSCTTRSPTAGSSRSSRRAGSMIRGSRSGTASRSRRRATPPGAITATPSRRRTSSSSPTIRSTATGRTRTSSRRASSARPSSTGSACTRSRRTRW